MKKIVLVLAVIMSSMSACGYAGVAMDDETVVIARNDFFLAGALRKVFVCRVTTAGLTQCSDAESP